MATTARRVGAVLLLLCALYGPRPATAGNAWLMLVNQSYATIAEAMPGANKWCGACTPQLGLDVSLDLTQTTHFDQPDASGNPRLAGSVADDFPVPAGHTCSKLYVALDSFQFFSMNTVWNDTAGRFDDKPGNAQNPLKLRFGILNSNASNYALPADSAVIWLNVTAPAGNWSNMTNFADGNFPQGRLDMTTWFELDLSSLNGGAGLQSGRYWLVVTAYVNGNYAYTYRNPSDTSSPRAAFYNMFLLWPAFNATPTAPIALSLYGANIVKTDYQRQAYYTQDYPTYVPWSTAFADKAIKSLPTSGYGISMKIFGWCNSDGTEPSLFTSPVPPPVCTWSTPLYFSNDNWECVTSSTNTTGAATPPVLPTPFGKTSGATPTSDTLSPTKSSGQTTPVPTITNSAATLRGLLGVITLWFIFY